MKVEGKAVLVTGGAVGIGKGLAEALLQNGANKVVIIDISPEGEKTVADLKDKFGAQSVLFIKCDVTNEVAFTGTFKSVVNWCGGHVHLVVNNAGMIDEKNWKKMLSVNFQGVVLGTNLAIEHMRKDKGGAGGVIINIASMVGLVPRFPFPVYTATKHAIVGFTNSWAGNPHLDDMGLRIGCLCPTTVDMSFQKITPDQVLYPHEFMDMLKSLEEMPISKTVEAFLELVNNDKSNGANLTITKKGMCYMKNELVQCDSDHQ